MPLIKQGEWTWESFDLENISKSANACWRDMVTALKSSLELPEHIVFSQVGREKIVNECLSHLRLLENSKLEGRSNRCILGAKGIGKTYLFKAIACMNLYLSPRSVSLFLDGRKVTCIGTHIANCVFKRWPETRSATRNYPKEFWQGSMLWVVRFLKDIDCHAFVVLDDVDCIFKRAGCKDLLEQLHRVADCGGNPNRIVVYLVAAETNARALVDGALPLNGNLFPTYDRVSLNHDKYKFRVQRAPLFNEEDFKLLLPRPLTASPSRTYRLCRGNLSELTTNNTVKTGAIYMQLIESEHRFKVVMAAFWDKLLSLNPDLVKDFQNNPFIVDVKKLQVSATDVRNHIDDTEDYTGVFYELSDRHLLYFDDSGEESATLSLVHPCDISWFVMFFPRHRISLPGNLSEAQKQSLLEPGGGKGREFNESLIARSLANAGEGAPPLQVIVSNGDTVLDVDLPPFVCNGDTVRSIWNLEGGNKPNGADLRLDNPELWNGEIFKEVPDMGADLVAIFVQQSNKRVLVVRISVKLGDAESRISRKANVAARSAEKQVRDLHRVNENIHKFVEQKTNKIWPEFTVHSCHALATVRKVGPTARNYFKQAKVKVWDSKILQHRWIPAIRKVVASNKELKHYMPGVKKMKI